MPERNIGVLIAHNAVSGTERSILWQWLTVKKIVVLCGFYPEGPNARPLASSLGTCGGAVGWGPCLQEVGVKTRSRGRIETKTHPSFIMCFGFCTKMRWHEQPTDVPEGFLGTDVLKELVTVKDSVPSWEENWIGSEGVPHLGIIQQKIPNFNMWCRHSFQNCVWLGTAIPSKNKHVGWAQQEKFKKQKEETIAAEHRPQSR